MTSEETDASAGVEDTDVITCGDSECVYAPIVSPHDQHGIARLYEVLSAICTLECDQTEAASVLGEVITSWADAVSAGKNVCKAVCKGQCVL